MAMKQIAVGFSLMVLIACASPVSAQSLWERRDPQTAYLFTDTRARNVGDLLTIVVNESTEVAHVDKTAGLTSKHRRGDHWRPRPTPPRAKT